MHILAHGVDIVEVERVSELLERFAERFEQRVFTKQELEDSGGLKNRSQHLAARFACKEAVLKALGTGLAGGISWHDVEVVRLPTGQPTVQLANVAQRRAMSLGIAQWSISLSHTREHAVASAIAWG
jgi:holo-[acyl-carrier protein] synthase